MKRPKTKGGNQVTAPSLSTKGFIVLNRQAQVWYGLKAGKPVFTDDWDQAKPLYNDEQLFNLKLAADYDDRDYEQVWL